MPRPRLARKAFLFVIHGARAGDPALRSLVERVRHRRYTVEPRVTWEAGDATRFAREGAERGVDAVVAVGGDGTVNEVVNGLGGSDVPLGIIPLGTANDFARQVGIPDDPNHAMDLILQRKPTRIDTAEVNGRRFLNVSSGGVGAETTAETTPEAKESLGPLAYAITGVRKLAELTPTRARFSGPGFDLACEFLLFTVGNARASGGGTLVTPLASVDDGLLDICIVEAMPLATFARLVLKLRKGDHLEEPGVHYVQLPTLAIDAAAPVTVNVDGEPTSGTSFVYRARPRDLLIHLAKLPAEKARA